MFDIIVTASDGTDSTDQAVAITVTDVDETPVVVNAAPVFTSGTTASVAENTAGVVYTAEASDADGDALTFSLSGTDADLFTIDSATGEVSFICLLYTSPSPRDRG